MAALMAALSIAFSFDGLQIPVEDRQFALQMFAPMTTWREVFDFMPPDEVLSCLVSDDYPSGSSGEVYAPLFRQAIAGPAISAGFSFGSLAPSSFQTAMRQSIQAAAATSAVPADSPVMSMHAAVVSKQCQSNGNFSRHLSGHRHSQSSASPWVASASKRSHGASASQLWSQTCTRSG